MERYENECTQLAELAKKQLNLPKNKLKDNFEDMNIYKIIDKIDEEFFELQAELRTNEPFSEIDKIDLEKAIFELGDTVACLVGLLAKLNKMKRELK